MKKKSKTRRPPAPPDDESRAAWLQIRAYPNERDHFYAHAKKRGMTFSVWARMELRRASGFDEDET